MDNAARDNLANERTFLAYVRTSLAFIGFGFVIARFAVFIREVAVVEHQSSPTGSVSVGFGVAMVGMGLVLGVFGAYRYARQQRALAVGRPERLSITAAVAITVVLCTFGSTMAYLLYRF